MNSVVVHPQNGDVPFDVKITFNSSVTAVVGHIVSVVAHWGTTSLLGNTATGVYTGTNGDGSFAYSVPIVVDQNSPFNFFQLVLTTSDGNETSTMGVYATQDRVATMRASVIEQFRGLPNLDAFIKEFGKQFGDVDEFFCQIITGLSLRGGTTQGVQMDNLGAILSQGRESLSDSDFADMLLNRIVEYAGQATPNDLINAANLLGKPLFLQYSEPGVASFQMVLISPSPIISHDDLINALQQAKLGGVKMQVLEANSPAFTYNLVDANHAGYNIGHYAGPY